MGQVWQRRTPLGATLCGVALGTVAGACIGPSSFVCDIDDDCASACRDGFCALPDPECASGLRWDDQSGDRTGVCVPTDAATSGPGTGTTAAGTSKGTSGTTTAGEAGTGPTVDIEFTDDEQAEFEAGQLDNLVWDGSRLRLLDGATSGTFTSRVFDATVVATWTDLTWIPEAPYGKPLPDDAMAEVGYAEGNVDMASNVLLLHLDADGAQGAGAVIVDSSGRGNDGTVVTNGAPSSAQAGVFGNAIDDVLDAYVSIPTGTTMDFDYGTDDFTWSIWFNFSHDCNNNNVFIGVDDLVGGGDLTPHLWLGCTNSPWPECPGTVGEPRPGGVLRSEQGNDAEGTFYCGSPPINDGVWHHLAMVKEGHTASTVRLYVDGQQHFEGAATFASPILMLNDSDYSIGGFSGNTFASEALLDEVAIWRRALTPAEITALSNRGSGRMGLEVRACAQPDCGDGPAFIGGSGLAVGDQFLDPPQALSPGTVVPVGGLTGRYLQYRMNIAATAGGPLPAVERVTWRGTPQ